MPWTNKTLAGYDDPPDWLLEERAEQRRLIAELRRKRNTQAAIVFVDFAVRDLADEVLPCRFDAFMERWRKVVVTELDHPRKFRDGEDALGFRGRWVISELVKLGYSVSGARRYKGEDDRIISKSA